MAVNAGEMTVVEFDSDTVTGLITVEGPEITQAKVDTTSIGAAGAKTSRPSKKFEVGPITMQYYFDSADDAHAAIEAASRDGDTYTYTETFEDGSSYTATVFVASHNISGSEDEGNIVADVTLEHTGDATFTAATGGAFRMKALKLDNKVKALAAKRKKLKQEESVQEPEQVVEGEE